MHAQKFFKILVSSKTGVIPTAALLVLLSAGCVAQRGIDFGHWAQSGQQIPLIRYIEPQRYAPPPPITQFAIFPVLGDLPPHYLDVLDGHALRESKLAFNAPVIPVERKGPMAQYVSMENMLPMGGKWNNPEAARLGQLLGVSHVICSRIRNWHQHQPQIISMDFCIVETTMGTTIMEIFAVFDAREQQVVLAMDKYLRDRSSRKYTRQSLDIMMRSPHEYSGFVLAQSMEAISSKLWQPTRALKPLVVPTDNIGRQ